MLLSLCRGEAGREVSSLFDTLPNPYKIMCSNGQVAPTLTSNIK